MNHQIVNNPFQSHHTGDVAAEAAETYIRAARRLMATDRAAGMASLDDVFLSGRPPAELHGRYHGEMLGVDIAPVITPLVRHVQERFRPWRGKTLDSDAARGDNMLSVGARRWLRVFLPFYNDWRPDSPDGFRALRFRTEVGPARQNPDVMVLKIDYDVPGNPGLTIRRVLDELVELAPDYYLGRAWAHWWGGAWGRVAFFSLRPEGR